MKTKQKILLVMLEFASWERGRAWGYTTNFGIEAGLLANNVDCVILPALNEAHSDSRASWLCHAQTLLAGKQFDQVWLWLVHNTYDDKFMEWIRGLAPIVVGWLGESLEYHPDEYALHPHLRERRPMVENQVKQMTHVIAVDEADAEYINRNGLSKSIWVPMAVLEHFIAEPSSQSSESLAAFYGSIYGERERWLRIGQANNLIITPPPPENATPYPELFDKINAASFNVLSNTATITDQHLKVYVDALRTVRFGCFDAWMDALRHRFALINLPSFGKVYTSRVVEAMAAGCPVVSWEVPDRPRNRALFEDGEEILLFRKDRPEELREHILKLRADATLAGKIASNALRKVWRLHTMEKRIHQILEWVESAREPVYDVPVDLSPAPGTIERFFEMVENEGMAGRKFAQPPKDGSDLASHLRRATESVSRGEIGTGIAIIEEALGQYPQETELKDILTSLKSKQAGTKIQDPPEETSSFYQRLFLHDPSWSSPHPNEDECARWIYIAAFLKRICATADMTKQPVRILDLGCGRGWLAHLASEFGCIEGIDPVDEVVKVARQHFPEIRFHAGTADVLLQSPDFIPFDVVICSEVIEHVPYSQQSEFVTAIKKLLRDGGYAIITTPRAEVFERWMQITKGQRQPVEDWLTEQQLRSLFSADGFSFIGAENIGLLLDGFVYLTDRSRFPDPRPDILSLYQVATFRREKQI